MSSNYTILWKGTTYKSYIPSLALGSQTSKCKSNVSLTIDVYPEERTNKLLFLEKYFLACTVVLELFLSRTDWTVA